MIPHPTTWQNARERERQQLLAAAQRYGRERRGLMGLRPTSAIRISPAARPPMARSAPSLVRPRYRLGRLRLLSRLLAVRV